MTKKRKNEIIIACEKCNKIAPVDIEKSTSNWTVYKTDEPCQCGGKFVTKIAD